ncbi:MAG TPA: BadF/BadG/BcrA/BcrD ATPase family protein [Kofleriaceae bacterium]|jgi:activator of 2-hydroxyglutaryl-CoA dehydratase/predicted nucleotide-binding protein (sugar kinase/HSP70/actin superfamily)|nr:BadF/BadG/BcrA/BcrD ATPase family protein [Kofleriaceae bacterium]
MSTPDQFVIGIDVGSTTVKMTVVDPGTKEILWSKYLRHETRQPEMTRDMLREIHGAFPAVTKDRIRVFITGSGGSPIAPQIGAKFVQEVNAVTMAVEKLHPDVGSVIELGGQDAKIIMFKQNNETGDKTAQTSMNDKCASGTGATIDKCVLKVGMPREEVPALKFDPTKLHHVAAKCGVFAETDIVNLVKSGIPRNEIMNSLADAIVSQNLAVLTRGNTLKSKVLLLGGPNTYLPFLQECWRLRIPEAWAERGYEYDKTRPVEELIFVPKNSDLYAAYGAVLFGLYEPESVGRYRGLEPLEEFIQHGRKSKLGESAGPGLVETPDQRDAFTEKYREPHYADTVLEAGKTYRGVIGLDGGSTSSKCVFIDENENILKKVYTLSKGNPIQDMKDMFLSMRQWAADQGATLEVVGFGVTGYAGDVLDRSLGADANIVETVAHMMSAKRWFPSVDVICDIGGQDIKVMFMQNGDVKNFRLSNSCSAGNGMLLQAMADQFGLPVKQYAEVAFEARLAPKFSYGCAVFLDSDRVNFQKEGYAREELLAGLALVLPKNIWQYVVQIPRMAELGRVFVLQGGTQKNLAALKAQVDYIEKRVPNAEVYLHPHCGEAGAIGAAFEALRVTRRRGKTAFTGLDQAIAIDYTSTNDEQTRCNFCPNNCSRTFIDTRTLDGKTARYISGFSCEKGTVENVDALKVLNKERQKRMKQFPNLVDYEAKLAFKSFLDALGSPKMPEAGAPVDDVVIKKTLLGALRHRPVQRAFQRASAEVWAKRRDVRIGIPRVLNLYSTGPFWRTYFEMIGVDSRNVVFSDETGEEMWQAGCKYGSVDPCYPSKVCQAHIHNLLFKHHEKKPLNYIFFPAITHIPTFIVNQMDTASCPVVSGTPKVIRAAFTKETDFFAERGITYLDTAVTLNESLLCKKQMFDEWGPLLGLTADENDFAVDQAFKAVQAFEDEMERKGKEILGEVMRENRVALVMLGRPYHNDPGLNHSVLEEFQALGYPILSMRSLPRDPETIRGLFAEDLAKGIIQSGLDVSDVWPENYSTNSVQKVWAAKYAARHPNLACLDLSSFKCGHDAPTYGLIDSVIASAGKAYSALHDIDANKPSGSIKIRVKTYAHTLMLLREKLEDHATKQAELDRAVSEKKLEMMLALQRKLSGVGRTDDRLDREIAQLGERVAAWKAADEAARPRGKRAAALHVTQQ